MKNSLDLSDHYQQYFHTAIINPLALNDAYHLRYKVFIEECGYKVGRPDDINKTEIDEYDDFAFHGMLFHKPSKQAIGYIRVIPFNKENYDFLPFEDYAKDAFDQESYPLANLRNNKVGEISRMSLLQSFRRRQHDESLHGYDSDSDSDTENNEKYNFRKFRVNYLPMCLSLISINMSFMANLEYSVAMMEHRLAVLIKKYGIQHMKIGNSIDHCGVRAPYLIDPQKTYDSLEPEVLRLYSVIRKELENSYLTN